MTIGLLFGFIATISWLVIAAVPAGAGELGTLRGLVEAEDGTPMEGVLVVLKAATGKERRTTANDAGRFVFEELPAGRYVVTFLRMLKEVDRRKALRRAKQAAQGKHATK